uniref:SKP1 component dimerisation domain-containing protein n=1 Tax=Oryza meridionalis TaxID=40149 RepID=A0A0E0FDV0_9ORYZ
MAAAAPSRLMLRFRDGELRLAATDDELRVPLGYAIGAPFIRNERIFRLLDEYARTHARGGAADAVANIAAWDRDFMARGVTDTVTLYDLFVGATALGIDGLSDLCAQMTADAVKGRPVKEVKALLGITDVGMTPEEELKLQQDNDAILYLR